MTKERIKYIDIARAVAIIFIVLGHTIVHSSHCGVIFKFLYSFHVMLFFMISGFLFNEKKNNYLGYVKNKFVRILVPYFIWAVVFIVPYIIMGKSVSNCLNTNASFDIIGLLKNVLIGNGNNDALKQNSSFWFLPALFTVSVTYYPIIKISEKYKKSKHIILIFLIIIGFLKANYISFVFPFGINALLEIGMFYYIGYLIKSACLLDNKKVCSIKMLIIIFIVGLFACFFNTKGVSAIDYTYGIYVLALISGFCLSFIVLALSKKIDNNKVLEYVGKNTMGILIFHKLVVVIF